MLYVIEVTKMTFFLRWHKKQRDQKSAVYLKHLSVCKRWRKKDYLSALPVLKALVLFIWRKGKIKGGGGGWKGIEIQSILLHMRKKTLICSNNKSILCACLSRFPLYQVFQTFVCPTAANSLLCYTPLFCYPIFGRLTIQEDIFHLEKSIIKRLYSGTLSPEPRGELQG